MTAPATAQPWYLTPEFRRFLPYLRVSPAYGHARLEMRSSTPRPLVLEALAFRAPCAACSTLIAPFRARKSTAKRGQGIDGVYLAVCCRLTDKIACSRGPAASAAYTSIEAQIDEERRRRGETGGLL